MAVTAARLRAVVTAETAQGQAGLKAFGQQVTQTRTAANADLAGMTGSFKAFGAGLGGLLAPLGISIGVAQLISFGKEAVGAASDVSEAYNKVNVVFGEVADQITQFARSSTTDLGMSRAAAYEALGTFGNLFTSMGLGRQPAADMSTGLVKLAADLASFNNIDPSMALEKLRSGIVGEAEPLRTLGINITAAATQAKALELGLIQAGGELTTQAAVAARYALIMEQSANAQGDFSRTADGLANSSRTVAGEMENLRANLGALVEKPWTATVHVVAEGLGNVNKTLTEIREYPELKLKLDVEAAQNYLTYVNEQLRAAEANGRAAGRGVDYWRNTMAIATAELVKAKDAKGAYADIQADLNEQLRSALPVEADMAERLRESAAAASDAAAAITGLAIARGSVDWIAKARSVGLVDRYDAQQAASAQASAAQGYGWGLMRMQAEMKTTNTAVVSDYKSKMSTAIDDLSAEIKSAFSEAQQFSIGLSDLRPGGAQGANAPGANGAFENIYRLQAYAANGSWGETAAQYGLDQAGAAEIVKKFQQGIWDASVMQVVDKEKLIAQIQQAQVAKSLMDAVAADLAKESKADPKLIKAMLGMGTSGTDSSKTGLEEFGSSAVAALIAGIDASLTATGGTELEARGRTAWDKIGGAFVRQAEESDVFAQAINRMVDTSLARYTSTDR